MPAIDFTTILGRLLQDGRLRDDLEIDPESVAARMELRESDRAALLELNAEDLEFQAQVLLRKRLDAVRRVIPKTCGLLSDQTWPLFSQYARACWPKEKPAAPADAYAFCTSLKSAHSDAVSELEWNRLRFAFSGKYFAANLLRRNAPQNKTALQILFRFRPSRWREVLLYAQC